MLSSLAEYRRTLQPERAHFFAQYRPVDVALRVVGTGSVGLRCYVIFLQGPSRRPDSDPLFLQVKQEAPSVYSPYLPEPANAVRHQGERVRDGQRMMQLVSDPFLGYTTIDGRDYLVRQFNDHKATLDLAVLDAPTLHGYATLCGEVLARGHARGGDPAVIAAYIGSGKRFAASILRFSLQYAQKTRHDWTDLCKAIEHQAVPEPAEPAKAAPRNRPAASKSPH